VKLVAKFAAGVLDTGGKFAAGVIDTSGAPWLVNISAKFLKKFKTVLMGYSGADTWKKPEAKNLVTRSL
jgi:hypothetical protein